MNNRTAFYLTYLRVPASMPLNPGFPVLLSVEGLHVSCVSCFASLVSQVASLVSRVACRMSRCDRSSVPAPRLEVERLRTDAAAAKEALKQAQQEAAGREQERQRAEVEHGGARKEALNLAHQVSARPPRLSLGSKVTATCPAPPGTALIIHGVRQPRAADPYGPLVYLSLVLETPVDTHLSLPGTPADGFRMFRILVRGQCRVADCGDYLVLKLKDRVWKGSSTVIPACNIS